MNDHLKTFLRGSAVSLLGTFLLGVVNYLIRRTLCGNLSLADYGLFYSTFALLSMIFNFTDLGMTQSGTVMIAAAENSLERDTVFSQLFFIKGILAVLCAFGIFLCLSLKKEDGRLVFLILFLAYFVVQVLNGTIQALWGGQKKYSFQQTAGLAIAVSTLVLLFSLGKVTPTAVCGCFLLPVSAVFLGSYLVSKLCGLGALRMKVDRPVCRKILTSGGIVAVTTTLLSVMYYMDTIMLNSLRGAEDAGLYNIALPIMQIVQAGMIFPAIFLPIAVDMNKKHEYEKLHKFVRGAVICAVAALLPVGLFFHLFGAVLIRLLFSPAYTAAAPAVTLLCIGLVFFTLGNFLFQIMLSIKKIVVMTYVAVVSAVSNLVLNYYLINRAGIAGAAAATLASYAIFAFLTCFALENNLRRMKNACP